MNKIKMLRNLLLGSFCVLLVSCGTMGRAPTLSQGSSVAIVSDLNNQATYDSIGTTVFQNSHFQYASANLRINQNLLYPVKRTLEQKGYKVTILPIPTHTPLASLSAGSGTLSTAEKNYLMQVLNGRKIDRVIVMTKNTPFIYGLPTNNTVGYGYVQKSTLGIKDTAIFAAVSIAVIDTHHFNVSALRSSYLTEAVNANLFSNAPNEVSSASISYLNQWLSSKFVPNVQSTLNDMGAIT